MFETLAELLFKLKHKGDYVEETQLTFQQLFNHLFYLSENPEEFKIRFNLPWADENHNARGSSYSPLIVLVTHFEPSIQFKASHRAFVNCLSREEFHRIDFSSSSSKGLVTYKRYF